jgi:3-isopropylmalate/(R)-2-methylmalate dehydratase small subunit
MEELSPGAATRLKGHPVIVAGEAFGYGTGREAPARALRAAGVRAIVSVSFGRMFYRNAINNGICAVECPALVRSAVADGDVVEIDAAAATIRCDGRVYPIAHLPQLLQAIVAAGDLIEYGRHAR